jgi:uncharacterized phage-associated protein
MYFDFGTRKIIEAAAVLLRSEACHRMGYMRLLKLLYIADRESLAETGRPIIGTRPVAMDLGPVHSKALNLAKGTHYDGPLWAEFIARDGYVIELKTDPGVLSLSRYEIGKLNEVLARYRDLDDFDLSEITHDFPEWQRNYQAKTSTTIPMEDIIEAVGRSEDLQEIMKDAESSKALDDILGAMA